MMTPPRIMSINAITIDWMTRSTSSSTFVMTTLELRCRWNEYGADMYALNRRDEIAICRLRTIRS